MRLFPPARTSCLSCSRLNAFGPETRTSILSGNMVDALSLLRKFPKGKESWAHYSGTNRSKKSFRGHPCDPLKTNHKASGLAAGTINQMLSSPALPPRARVCVTILTYIEEKLAGLYGHNKKQLRRFAAGSLLAGNVLVATLAWIIVTLVQ
jgi:hypothetical protein